MLLARLAGDVRRTVQAVRAVAPGRVTVALRATLAVALPLSAGVAAGRPELGAAASFGALAVLYVPQAPYRYRARVVRRVGLGLVAAVLLGSLAAGHGVVTALVAGLVAGTASFACQAAELPPPRELMLVMAVLAATDMPSDPAEAATRAGLAAAGALVAWLLTMAPALAGRWRAPEQAAVVAAMGAVAGLLDAVGSAGAGAARHAAVTGVQRARAAVSQAALPPGHPLAGLVVAAEALLEAALHVEVEATAPLDPGWAAAVRALVPAVHGLPVGNVVLPETAATAGAGLLTRALTDARTASVPPAAARTLPPWPALHRQLAAGLRRHSVVLPSAARIGIAVAVGVGLGQALGLGHAYWVGLTAAAVLQGSNLAVTRGRVLHRLAGTVAGVVLTFAVLGWNPPLWVVVLAVAAAQFAVELVIPVHYGLAVTAITVLALGLFHLGSPTEDVSSALGARLIDTAIGAALALVLRRVLWPRATVRGCPSGRPGSSPRRGRCSPPRGHPSCDRGCRSGGGCCRPSWRRCAWSTPTRWPTPVGPMPGGRCPQRPRSSRSSRCRSHRTVRSRRRRPPTRSSPTWTGSTRRSPGRPGRRPGSRCCRIIRGPRRQPPR